MRPSYVKYTWNCWTLLKGAPFSLPYLAQAKPATLFKSISNHGWICIGSACLTERCQGWEKRVLTNRNTNASLCLSPMSTITQNILLPLKQHGHTWVSGWYSWLGGQFLPQLIKNVLSSNTTFLFLPLATDGRSASIIATSTVAEVLALSAAHFWARDVQTAPSHSCRTTVCCISWMMLLGYFRQFYFFLFCVGKKQ